MIIFVLMSFLLILTYTDIREYRIPNVIVLPAIAFGVFVTGQILEAMTAFIFMALICRSDKKPKYLPRGFISFCEGDIKLFTMIASFIGWMFLPALLTTILSVKFYRFLFNHRLGLPIAPFACVSTIFLITAAAIFHNVCRMVA